MEGKHLTRRAFLQKGAVTAATLLVAACKPAPAPTSAPAPTTAAATSAPQPTDVLATAVPPTPAPPAKPELNGKFVFASHNEWEARLELTKIFFERNYPGGKYQHDITPGLDPYMIKIQTQIAGGTPPDVMLMHETRARGFSAKGLVLQLDDFQAKSPMPGELEQHIGLEQLKYQGKIFVWPSLFACYVIFYNKDLFDAAAVPYPKDDWTWTDFFEMSKELTTGENMWGHNLWADPGWQGDWNPILRCNGGQTFDEADTTCLLDSPEAIATFDYMRSNWCSKVVPTPAIATQAGGAGPLFFAGQVAMGYFNPSSLERFHSLRTKDFKYGIVFLPAGPKGRFTRIGGSQYAIPKGAKNPEVAWDLMRWMIATEEAMKLEFEKHKETLTPRMDLHAKYNAPKDPVVTAMVSNWYEVGVEQPLKYGAFIRHSKVGPEFVPVLKAELNALTECDKPAADVAKSVVEKANQMLKEFKE